RDQLGLRVRGGDRARLEHRAPVGRAVDLVEVRPGERVAVADLFPEQAAPLLRASAATGSEQREPVEQRLGLVDGGDRLGRHRYNRPFDWKGCVSVIANEGLEANRMRARRHMWA